MVEQFAPIFTVVCTEGGKPVARDIAPFIFTPTNVKNFFDSAKKYPVLFGRPINNEKQFLEHFVYLNRYDEPELNGMFWTDQYLTTVFYITNITPTECDIHYTFLDGRQKGREELVKTMMKYVINAYGFQRLNAGIPVYATGALTYARKLGLTEEGTKRKCSFWNNNFFDQIQFGILKDEVLNL